MFLLTYVDTQSAGLISVYLIFRAITNPVIGSRYRSRPTARQMEMVSEVGFVDGRDKVEHEAGRDD